MPTKTIKQLQNRVIQGDCLEIMPQIPDKSIDLILCDLPYGTTQNKWDSIIDLDKLWKEYKRIIKDNGTPAKFRGILAKDGADSIHKEG